MLHLAQIKQVLPQIKQTKMQRSQNIVVSCHCFYTIFALLSNVQVERSRQYLEGKCEDSQGQEPLSFFQPSYVHVQAGDKATRTGPLISAVVERNLRVTLLIFQLTPIFMWEVPIYE